MIRKTKDYKQFSYFERNRKLSKEHLKALEKSIKEDNKLELNPIIVTRKGKVIDGQHRLEVAKKLNIPIYYVVADNSDMDTVIRLQTQKTWTAKDYIANYEKAGIDDFKILREFIEYYKLPVTLSAKLLYGVMSEKSLGGGGEATELIRNGKFRVKDLKGATDFAEKYKEIYDHIKKPFARTRTFVLALKQVTTCSGYRQEHLVNKLKHFANRLNPRQSVKEYMRDIEDIYNLKSKNGLVRLF